MKIEELKEKLNHFINNPEKISAKMYLVLEINGEISIKLADIEGDSQNSLRNLILSNLKSIFVDKDDLYLLDLSSYDERKNVVYKYDLEEFPNKIKDIKMKISDEKKIETKFNFKSDKLIDIKTFFVEIGNNTESLQIFRRNYPINIYSRDKFMWIEKNERFSHLEKDILKFDGKIDFFYIGDELFVYDLSVLEKYFGFEEIIKKSATESITKIKELNLVENCEVLEHRINEMSFSRKLTKIAKKSPVMNLPKDKIINFTKTYPELESIFKYSSDDKMIKLDTKKSQNMFLKLLNDDFLHSQLTDLFYESLAKDNVTQENNERE